MIKSLVSIIVPVYNSADYLSDCIDSVIQQTYKKWELILVDDASADISPQIIHKYIKNDDRIKYLSNNINLGIPASLNKGIDISQGDYVARLDSDDMWIDKEKIEKQVEYMNKNKKYALIGSLAIVIDKNNNKISDLTYPLSDSEIRNQMLRHNCFISSSILMRKKYLLKPDYYDISSKVAEDYGLWLKIGKKGKVLNMPEFMVAYRINPHGISQNRYKEQVETSIRVVTQNRYNYPNFTAAYILWNLRKYYPTWFRGALSRKVKNTLQRVR